MNSEEKGNSNSNKIIPVRVAVRVRPFVEREKLEYCESSLEASSDNSQIIVQSGGQNRQFTFDYVFPPEASQEELYTTAVSKIIKEIHNGFNVTILAYGQTGSGKTYSMGTNSPENCPDETMGIIPRAIRDMFSTITEREDEYQYLVKCSFVELYAENLYDLLAPGPRDDNILDIREGVGGEIRMQGVTEVPVASLQETMRCLEQGSHHRATGSTAMNAQSSRSHALFCVTLQQWKKQNSDHVVCAKFTLVDLAGSERAKKTGTTGQRFKEGIHINSGLLCLGKVISALGSGKEKHIPYRESKLTRLLQDSLGGNSHTLMVACVSPADNSLEETLSTLAYADRARMIKNKPMVNCDPKAAEIARLKQQVHELQLQLISASAGRVVGEDCKEMSALIQENKLLKEENLKLMLALQDTYATNTNMAVKDVLVATAREKMDEKLNELQARMDSTVQDLNDTIKSNDSAVAPVLASKLELIKQVQQQVADLQTMHRENEEQLVSHELTLHQAADISAEEDEHQQPSNGDGSSSPRDKSQDESASPAADCSVASALMRSQKGQELASLNHALAQKEELMRKMLSNDKDIANIRSSYERAIQELQERISTVEHEKESLQQQIVSAPSNPASKLAEQRRKRVQELTLEINDLKQKVIERNKALKMKEMSEKRVELLSNEIQAMKQARVKLIRQMKEDNDKFKRAQQLKNKEIEKLKMQERKKDFKMIKMERMNKMQQNVLRRKIEEASSLNKRLKDALELQKVCSEKRATANLANRQQRLKNWLEGELELVSVKHQAKQSLESLREDRKFIGNKLTKVEQQLQHNDLSEEFRTELLNKQKDLSTDLQLRTAQINELQQKVLEGDGESLLERKRFEGLQGMSETKAALTMLFNTAVQHKAQCASSQQELQELQAQYKELVAASEETEAMLEEIKAAHEQQIMKLEKDHENKVLCLLRQNLSSDQEKNETSKSSESSNTNHQQVLALQTAELAKLSDLRDELVAKTQECEELKTQLQLLQQKQSKILVPTREKAASNFQVPPLPRPQLAAAKNEKRRKTRLNDDEDFTISSEDSDEDDDFDNMDPAWRRTPLCVRIKAMKRRARPEAALPEDNKENNASVNQDTSRNISATKRESDGGVHCGCMTDCLSKRCKCRRNGSSCSTSCRCNALKCANKSILQDDSSSLPQLNAINSTFDISPNVSKKLKLSSETEEELYQQV